MRWTLPLGLVALVIAGAPLTTVAQQNPSTDPLASSDFVTRALRAADQHKAILTLAAERAENPAVRRFAETILGDLEANNKELRELARPHEREAGRPMAELGAVPEISAEEIPYKRREYQRLRALYGTAFDKQFMSAVVLGYENAIRRYETEATRGDEATRPFANDNLPRLRTRLDEARAILAEIEGKPR